MADAVSMQTRARKRAIAQPIRISEADERRLTLYLGELGTQFERSVFGRILEVQELNGAFSTRCRRCKGEGIVDGADGFAVVVEEVKQSRQATTQRHSIEAIPDESTRFETRERQVPRGGWCRPCNGTGSVPKPEERAPRCAKCDGRGRVAAFNNRPGCHDLPCRECLGAGRARLTAEPTGSSLEGSDNVPNEEALEIYAVTSRQLAAVRDRSASCARGIELLFGDQGARWARTAEGRLFALYQLTPSGKRLAKWAEAQAIADKEQQLAKAAAKTRGGKPKPRKKGWTNPKPLGFSLDPFSGARPQLRPVEPLLGVALPPAPARETDNERPRPDVELTIQDRIGSEALTQRTRPDPYRAKLLLEAAEQARQLYVRASKLWVQVGASLGKKPTPRQLAERAAVIRIHDRLRSDGHDTAANYIAAQVKAR